VVASLAAVAAASTVVGLAFAVREPPRPGAWRLLGVRDGGRTLVIEGPAYGGCEKPVVEAREHDDRIEVRAETRLDVDGAEACELMMHLGARLAVPLRRPVGGRAVVGPRRGRAGLPLAATASADDRGRVRLRPPPTVVGLRFLDARHALCIAGYRATAAAAIGRRPPRSAAVLSQGPPSARRPGPISRSRFSCRSPALPTVVLRLGARG